jgi:hypothetical protein
MGRPRKEGMDYFPHDVDASQDEKIEAMRTMFGNDGYAFYFIALERIYRSGLGELDVSNRLFTLTLANKVMVSEEILNQMIEASTDFGLFDKDEYIARKVLTSNGIQKRSVQINGLRDKWRGKKNDNDDSFLDGKPMFSPEKTVEKSIVFPREKCIKESKEKESKVKQSKVVKKNTNRTFGEFVEMSEDEYQSLLDKYGEPTATKCIQELDNYKGSTGKKYKSDYRAILSWVADRVSERDRKQQVLQYPVRQAVKTTEKPKMVMHTATAQVTDDAFDFEEAKRIAALLDGGVK